MLKNIDGIVYAEELKMNVFVLLSLVVWIILCIKNKKIIISLPYLLIIFITPIYVLLDQIYFLNIFGCGCVPIVQNNMLNIPFNANDLRILVYSILMIVVIFIGGVLSRRFKSIKEKILYIFSIFIINIVLALYICQLYVWN